MSKKIVDLQSANVSSLRSGEQSLHLLQDSVRRGGPLESCLALIQGVHELSILAINLSETLFLASNQQIVLGP